MSIPYSSTPNLPQGFESATVNAVAYKVDGNTIPSLQNRLIGRTDELGDASDFMLRKASEHVTGSITMQRANTATVLPPEGVNFSYDYDRSGTNSTLVVQNVTVARDKDAFDTFEVDVVVQEYQG
jgi:hypothetical protein